jgi:hypothetical protein
MHPGLTATTQYRRTTISTLNGGFRNKVFQRCNRSGNVADIAPVISRPAPATANTDRDGAGNCTTAADLYGH